MLPDEEFKYIDFGRPRQGGVAAIRIFYTWVEPERRPYAQAPGQARSHFNDHTWRYRQQGAQHTAFDATGMQASARRDAGLQHHCLLREYVEAARVAFGIVAVARPVGRQPV